jgi:hypothetical protein
MKFGEPNGVEIGQEGRRDCVGSQLNFLISPFMGDSAGSTGKTSMEERGVGVERKILKV